jgi:hypothetical protein
MPICITFIKVMQMHWIILLFYNTQVGLVITILSHLFNLRNTLWTHYQCHIQLNSHMHYLRIEHKYHIQPYSHLHTFIRIVHIL